MRKQRRLSPEHKTCTWALTCSSTVKAVFQRYRSMYRWFWTPWIALWDCAGLQVHAGSSEQWGHFPPPGCLGCEEGAVLALTGQQGSSSSAQQQVVSKSKLVKSSTVACGSFYKSHLLTVPLSRSNSRALSPRRKSCMISADFHTCWESGIQTLLYWKKTAMVTS